MTYAGTRSAPSGRAAPRSATGGQRREKVDALLPRHKEPMSGRFWRAVALDQLIGGPSAEFVTDSCSHPGPNAGERVFRLN
jgi:hypothetical protein